ncbi:hypothetical protein GMO_10230 [Gluconobacter morbifer G707]|uniref:Uncharacterized protein n=1 Tax=Gluconobacter morbifer G707 TaxID=1088869 RepID=G6XHQ7_9PROT|nr:hypothetical protein GMO_10230 [Gluconobacter morbifer G707]
MQAFMKVTGCCFIQNRTYIHRSDVLLPDFPSIATVVARCARPKWQKNAWDSRVMSLSSPLHGEIILAVQRDAEARRGETFPRGVVRSVLGRGPRLGDCGRKKGGAPSD